MGEERGGWVEHDAWAGGGGRRQGQGGELGKVTVEGKCRFFFVIFFFKHNYNRFYRKKSAYKKFFLSTFCCDIKRKQKNFNQTPNKVKNLKEKRKKKGRGEETNFMRKLDGN